MKRIFLIIAILNTLQLKADDFYISRITLAPYDFTSQWVDEDDNRKRWHFWGDYTTGTSGSQILEKSDNGKAKLYAAVYRGEGARMKNMHVVTPFSPCNVQVTMMDDYVKVVLSGAINTTAYVPYLGYLDLSNTGVNVIANDVLRASPPVVGENYEYPVITEATKQYAVVCGVGITKREATTSYSGDIIYTMEPEGNGEIELEHNLNITNNTTLEQGVDTAINNKFSLDIGPLVAPTGQDFISLKKTVITPGWQWSKLVYGNDMLATLNDVIKSTAVLGPLFVGLITLSAFFLVLKEFRK